MAGPATEERTALVAGGHAPRSASQRRDLRGLAGTGSLLARMSPGRRHAATASSLISPRRPPVPTKLRRAERGGHRCFMRCRECVPAGGLDDRESDRLSGASRYRRTYGASRVAWHDDCHSPTPHDSQTFKNRSAGDPATVPAGSASPPPSWPVGHCATSRRRPSPDGGDRGTFAARACRLRRGPSGRDAEKRSDTSRHSPSPPRREKHKKRRPRGRRHSPQPGAARDQVR